MKVLFVLLSVLTLTACAEFKSPEILGFDGVSDFSLDEQSVFLTLNAQVKNPNNKTLKVHAINTDIIVNDRRLGQLKSLQKIRLIKNKAIKISLPVVIEIKKGAMLQIGMLALRDSANFVFEGNVIGGWGPFKKSVPFRVEEKLPTKSLIRP
jgi:LEA14-like dessication related protein